MIPKPITITGILTLPDNTPTSGTIQLKSSVVVTHATQDALMLPDTIDVVVGADGVFAIQVPSSNDPAWSPTNYSWEVTVKTTGRPAVRWSILVPYNAPGDTISLGELAPVPSASGQLYALVAHTHADFVTDAELATALSPFIDATEAQALATDLELSAGLAALQFTVNAGYDLANAAIPKANGEVVDSTLTVRKADGSSAIRLRSTGGAVDYDIHGDIIVGSWAEVGFTGVQTQLQRWRGDGSTFAGKTFFGSSVYAEESYVDPGVEALLGGKGDAIGLRLVGYLAGVGNPTAGTWAVGDVIARDDGLRRCAVAGTPGTWRPLSDPIVRPSDHNLAGWTFDTALIQGGTVLPSPGVGHIVRIRASSALISNILLHFVAAGTGVTAAYATLHTDAGVQIGATNDQATAFNQSGLKTFALTAPQAVTPGDWYKVRFWFTGTTGPTVSRALNSSSGILNAGLVAPNFRYATADSGLTTAALAPANIGAMTGSATAWWMAVS